MSGPTKGMVAGQPIQTGELTKEYEEGYERAGLGKGPRERGRFVWDEETKQMVRVDADWEPTEPKRSQRIDVSYMDGLRATDGTDISSMKKRREYMHRKGLADFDDFTEHRKIAAKRRAAELSGDANDKERRETIGKLLYDKRAEQRRGKK